LTHDIFFGVLQVHRKLVSSTSKGDMYETQLLDEFADTDATKEFFACLDQNLNKVNKFYRTKEKEFLDRGESLKKQMDILIELKSAFMEKKGKGSTSQHSKEEESITSCTFYNSGK
jgi:SPX domain protein involved in polyphosphate accumulation